MTTKRRSHKNNRARTTAAERVDAYELFIGSTLAPRRKCYLLKILADHAREAVARYKRRTWRVLLP